MINKQANLSTGSGRGQIIVLAAFLMIILIGVTGLAIDVSAAYMADRWQRSVADAAALAGGQDLQIPGSRQLPDAAHYNAARIHAMEVLVKQLQSTGDPGALAGSAACQSAGGCALPGTPYAVSIRTPSPSAVDCQPARCMQVAIRQPSFGLTFARIFGINSWQVNTASVAGISQLRQYGVVTLRPGRLSGTTQNKDDLKITGGSKVVVSGADVATNTNIVCSGAATGSELKLDPGFSAFHWDTYEAWVSPPGDCYMPPTGEQMTSPIPDPNYPIPNRTAVGAGCPTSATSICTYATAGSATLSAAACAAEIAANVPSQYAVNTATATCYKPGIYTFELSVSQNTDFAILTPGVYFFDRGINIGGSLIGGYQGGSPGVALVFKECTTNAFCPLKGNNSVLMALNFGSSYKNASGQRATAAQWAGGLVQTSPMPNSPLMSIIVVPDNSCLASPFPNAEPANSCTTSNSTISLPGNGNLFVAGVQYAPTDNATVNGNGTAQQGVLGQVISWTLTFTGGASLNLEAAILDDQGVLRLDPACSPTQVCNP